MDQYLSVNADVGEGIPTEEILFPYIDACNIACGGHYGSYDTMLSSVQLAQRYGVKIGAHPSYPDKENFGRKSMTIDSEHLHESVREQVSGLAAIIDTQNAKLHHIKAHGALYNDIAKDGELMNTYLDAMDVWNDAYIVLPWKAKTLDIVIERGYNILYEAFLDRAYMDDYSLAPRSIPNALIQCEETALRQAMRLQKGTVLTVNNKTLDLQANTYCIHGDNGACIPILNTLRAAKVIR